MNVYLALVFLAIGMGIQATAASFKRAWRVWALEREHARNAVKCSGDCGECVVNCH